jgi:hypothetical protein
MLGVAVMALGAALALIAFDGGSAEMAAALVAAQVVMAVHMIPQARPLLRGTNVTVLALRATAGATSGWSRRSPHLCDPAS